MRWTCPKCGKKLDVSNEQLIANDGVIICPQCLLQAHQPIPKARVSTRREDNSSASSPKRQQQSINFDVDEPSSYTPRKATSASQRQSSIVDSAIASARAKVNVTATRGAAAGRQITQVVIIYSDGSTQVIQP